MTEATLFCCDATVDRCRYQAWRGSVADFRPLQPRLRAQRTGPDLDSPGNLGETVATSIEDSESQMSSPDGITFTTHDHLLEEAASVIDGGLESANADAAPLESVRPLCCFAQTSAGTFIGGAIGRSWGTCCELRQLWVSAAYRQQGIGAALIRQFEDRSRLRNCTLVYLETFSFQAPDFYRELGYATRYSVPGFPGGIVKHMMTKKLQLDTAE